MSPTVTPQTLLNTRPNPMGEALTELATQRQLSVCVAPIIDTVAVPEASLNAVFDHAFNHIDDAKTNWIFISRTAVKHFVQHCGEHKPFQPAGQIIAVGPGSQAELTLAFPNLAEKVIVPEEANSESLIKLPQLKEGTTSVIVKGKGGREVIQQHLRSQGGEVIELDLYVRNVKAYSQSEVAKWKDCDFVLCTSKDIADGIISTAQQHLSEKSWAAWLAQKRWITISSRIESHLISQGIAPQNIRVTAQPDNETILNVLSQWQGDVKMTDTPNKNADKETSTTRDDALARLTEEIRTGSKKPETSAKKRDEENNSAKGNNESTPKTQSSGAKDQAPAARPKATAPLSKTAVFALLLSLVAIAGAGFIGWQAQMWLQTQTQVETLNQQAVNNNLNQINQLQTQLEQLSRRLNSQTSQQNNDQKSLKSLNQRIKELSQSQPNEWLATEALYLVNLAERKIVIEQDVDTALMLLANASNRLTAMNDPSVFPLRKVISEDIAQLHGTTRPDRDAIYLSLSGVLDQVNSLKFSHFYIPAPSQATQADEVSSDINDWQQNLKISLRRFLDNFVTIKHRDANIEPQIPQQQQWFIRANISRQLLLAQQSVLNQNNALYGDALTRTIHWMQQYFDLNDPQVVATINTLSELQNRNVELDLPTTLASQAVLANFVNGQLNRLKTGEGQ